MTRSSFRTAVEEILDAPAGTLQDTDSRDTIDSWTSLADVQILATINSEFGLEPEPALLEAETFGDMLAWLTARGAFRA